MREYGRWLTVKSLGHIRTALTHIAARQEISIEELLYCSFEELEHPSRHHVQLRQEELRRFNAFTLPEILANPLGGDSQRHRGTEARGIAPGTASGVLVSISTLEQAPVGDAIVFTECLSPDLVRHLPNIKGIVALRGGILSHLSIMAREAGIPVVVISSLESCGLCAPTGAIGIPVRIDGTRGSVEPVSK